MAFSSSSWAWRCLFRLLLHWGLQRALFFSSVFMDDILVPVLLYFFCLAFSALVPSAVRVFLSLNTIIVFFSFCLWVAGFCACLLCPSGTIFPSFVFDIFCFACHGRFSSLLSKQPPLLLLLIFLPFISLAVHSLPSLLSSLSFSFTFTSGFWLCCLLE